MGISSSDLESKLQALRETYTAQLPGTLDGIDRTWQTLSRGNWDHEDVRLMHRLVHNLAGSSSTFGYPQLSQHARGVEEILKESLDDGNAPETSQRHIVATLLKQMREAVAEGQSVEMPVPYFNRGAYRNIGLQQRPLVYLLEGDDLLAEQLALQLTHFGYIVKTFREITGIRKALDEQRPAAVIADVLLPEGPLDEADASGELCAQCGPDLPVIFVSTRDDFEARLAAVRAGGDAYFVKPLEMASLIDRLDQLTRSTAREPYRILIVDDDATLAAHYGLVLEQADMQVKIVNRAAALMNALANFQPELILMDIYMPECSGLELAKLIRQQQAYAGVPIVFLSTETNLEKQLTALRLGGDEFLTKPIDSAHLALSVAIRAERARFLSALMVRDSLTGLFNHTRIKELLAVEMSRARRAETALTLVMIDIDHFKSVNDRFGHMMGDQVIKTLARLLQQRLRKSDSIGRYGGEEFAVVLPNCEPRLAHEILEQIRRLFCAMRFVHEGREFSVTFSAGLAAWPGYEEPGELTCAADDALYQAKQGGRNRIAVAGHNLPL